MYTRSNLQLRLTIRTDKVRPEPTARHPAKVTEFTRRFNLSLRCFSCFRRSLKLCDEGVKVGELGAAEVVRPLAFARVDTEAAGIVRGVCDRGARHCPSEGHGSAGWIQRGGGPLAAAVAEGVELPVGVVGLGGREKRVARVGIGCR